MTTRLAQKILRSNRPYRQTTRLRAERRADKWATTAELRRICRVYVDSLGPLDLAALEFELAMDEIMEKL